MTKVNGSYRYLLLLASFYMHVECEGLVPSRTSPRRSCHAPGNGTQILLTFHAYEESVRDGP